jgi:hypothetical protein
MISCEDIPYLTIVSVYPWGIVLALSWHSVVGGGARILNNYSYKHGFQI